MSVALLGSGIAAMLILELALIFDDFTVSYVADNHSVTTPFPFNIATAWAALEGSIVLWCLVLSGFTWFVFRSQERARDRLGAGALAVMALVSLFFFSLMITVSNPFETCVEAGARSCVTSSPVPLVGADAPADGNGPNALLQNQNLPALQADPRCTWATSVSPFRSHMRCPPLRSACQGRNGSDDRNAGRRSPGPS